PPLRRHRLQPRAGRQGQPGRPARYPDHRLDRTPPLRARRLAGTGRARLPERAGTAAATAGPRVPVARALRPAHADRPARGPPAVRLPDADRPALRLPGCQLHAGRRAADAALLPHGDGPEPPERDATP